MALTAIAFAAALLAAAAPAQATPFPASITSDTTLTKASSPYEVTDDVTVVAGVKLTVEPGVVINFENHAINAFGAIDATGTAANPIRFNYAGDTVHNPYNGRIFLIQTPNPSVFRHAAFDGSGVVAYSSKLTVSDSDFKEGPAITASGYETGPDFVDTTISGSRFDQSDVRLVAPRGTISVTGNTFSRANAGLAIGLAGKGNTTATITGNLIVENEYFGLTFSGTGSDWTASIRDNTIFRNRINVYSTIPASSTGSFAASGNNILDALQYDWFVQDANGTGEYHAENNWWGTADGQEIGTGIFDHKDDPSRGTVDYTPYLTAPSATAPPIPAGPTVSARLGQVAVKGPARAKVGKRLIYWVGVTNPGGATATGIELKVNGAGIKKFKAGGSIGAGASKVIKIGVRPKKPGKRKLTFAVTSANAGKKTVTKRIFVRRR